MFQLHYFFITIHHRIKYYNNVKMVELKQKNKNKKRTRRNSVYLFLIWSVKKMILRDIYAKNKQENDFAEKPNYILVLIFWQAFGQRRLTVKRVCSTWDSYRKPPRGGPKNKQQGGKGKKKKWKVQKYHERKREIETGGLCDSVAREKRTPLKNNDTLSVVLPCPYFTRWIEQKTVGRGNHLPRTALGAKESISVCINLSRGTLVVREKNEGKEKKERKKKKRGEKKKRSGINFRLNRSRSVDQTCAKKVFLNEQVNRQR